MIVHPIAPVFDAGSRILILGSFPSVRSREQGFYYGHPQNRFWPVLSAVLDAPLPESVEEKRALLLSGHIALWDVIERCDIDGSADSTIRNARPNDLRLILATADIRRIYLNGGAAARYYGRYMERGGLPESLCLPSTSPANAAWTLRRLIEAWSVIREYIAY